MLCPAVWAVTTTSPPLQPGQHLGDGGGNGNGGGGAGDGGGGELMATIMHVPCGVLSSLYPEHASPAGGGGPARMLQPVGASAGVASVMAKSAGALLPCCWDVLAV